MRRSAALLLALALAALPVAAAARPKSLKQRCVSHRYAKQHRKACARYRQRKRPANQHQTPVTTTPTGQQSPPAATPPPASPTTPAPAGTTAPATHIGVVAREYSLTLSRTSATPGPASVQLQNFGQDPHDLSVVRVDGSGSPAAFPLTGPGRRDSQTVTLAPGTYRLYCTLPGHDAAGMHATLTVG